MIFFVFSYNRGPFLGNCVESIVRCSPDSEIVVFDDQSDDPDTVRILKELSKNHRIVSSGDDSGHKHGGLYSNMQSALDLVEGDELICFTQDDTQVVRFLTDEDQRFIEACFSKHPDLGFISPAFIRGITLKRAGDNPFSYDAEMDAFFSRSSKRSAGVFYSDIFLSTSGRLRGNGWVFGQGEPANQKQAKSKFTAMAYMRTPFLMWLPNGGAYRGKTKTLALRLAERSKHCGFYPFQYMTEKEIQTLMSCSPTRLPVAEDFLKTIQGNPQKPWVYNPLQGSRVLKHLNQAELLLKSVLS